MERAGRAAACCCAATYGWSKPGGPTAGTVDLLRQCRLYVGSDTGVSHLAAMLDTPMIAFYMGKGKSPNELGVMQRANKRFAVRMDEEPAPEQLLKYIRAYAAPGRPEKILAILGGDGYRLVP